MSEIKSIQESYFRIKKGNIDYKKLASDTPQKIEFKNFTGNINGRVDINYLNTNIECLFTESTTKRLFIFFSAAGRKKSDTLFQRLTWCNELNGMCLYIEDPMYKKYSGLECGWFYGTTDEPYLIYINEIIKKIINFHNINNQDVYLVGSSCGGYAALYCANLIEGSIAYAYNPQITPENWIDATNFKKSTNIDLSGSDLFNRKSLKYIKDNTSSKFFIFYNSASVHDQKQFEPFLNDLGLSKSDSFEKFNNIYFMKKNIKNHNRHFCVANINDFIETINLLNVNDLMLHDLANIHLNNFKTRVLLDEKNYYSELWFKYLKNDFPNFLNNPVDINDTWINFKVKNYQDVLIFRTSSQKISKYTELVCYILHNSISFDPVFIDKMKEIAKKYNYKIHVYKDEFIRISHGLSNFDKAHENFINFIKDLHTPIFSAYALAEIKAAKTLDEKNKAIEKCMKHLQFLSNDSQKSLLANLSLNN